MIIALKQSGFFDTTPLAIGNREIAPIDFTSRLLIKEWKLNPGEEEFTIMKVILKGEAQTIIYDLYDQYDPVTQTSSMARTTGYTCTAAVNLVIKEMFIEKGVFPPESVGKYKSCFDFILNYLNDQ